MNIERLKVRIEYMKAQNKLYEHKLKLYPDADASYLRKRIYQNKNTIDVILDEIKSATRHPQPDHVENIFTENSRIHHTILNKCKQKNISTVKELKEQFPYIFGAGSKAKAEIDRLIYH